MVGVNMKEKPYIVYQTQYDRNKILMRLIGNPWYQTSLNRFLSILRKKIKI